MKLQAGYFFYTKAWLQLFFRVLFGFRFVSRSKNANKRKFFPSVHLCHLPINPFAIVSKYSTIYDIVLQCFMPEMNYVYWDMAFVLFWKINIVCVVFLSESPGF